MPYWISPSFWLSPALLSAGIPLFIILLPITVLFLSDPNRRRLSSLPLPPSLPPSLSRLPLINDKQPGEILYRNAKRRFVLHAQGLIKAGFARSANAFRLMTDNGPQLVLSAQYADEIGKNDHLSLGRSVAREFFAHIPGFEAFREGSADERVFHDAIRLKLTQSLALLTDPISEETAFALQQTWTDDEAWHEIVLKPTVLEIIARVSARVFLGPDLCRNPAWIRTSVDYTVNSFLAAQSLRLWPRFLRRIVHWFLPSCRKIRAQIREAREIIAPVLEERRRRKVATTSTGAGAGAGAAGATTKKQNDALEWVEEIAQGRRYDPTLAQLLFSVAAIHTTSDLLTQLIFHLCEQDDAGQHLVQALREEVISVMRADGLKKTSLYKLRLMDSVLKESQRLKPMNIVTLRRIATQTITLSDGITIPQGSSLVVSAHHMWDPSVSVYPDAERFDGYRFLRLHEENTSTNINNTAQLITPSPNHLGFGHGKHACPGRFFAANEVKIVLCHMLLKYDWRVIPEKEHRPSVVKMGFRLISDPKGRVLLRRRRNIEVAL